jgi:hyperosmotically inducible periplasmic protein
MAMKMRLCALLGAVLLAAASTGFAQKGDNRDRPSASSSIGDRIDDTVLNTKVRAALVKERSLGSGDVWVKADGSAVTLGGSVASAEERRKAEQVARTVAGVKSVKNEIKVDARAK